MPQGVDGENIVIILIVPLVSGTGEPHRVLGRRVVQKKNRVATPFHSNRMERRRHVAPFLGSHAANHASKLKEAEVATANTDSGRAPGLVPAFLVALTKLGCDVGGK